MSVADDKTAKPPGTVRSSMTSRMPVRGTEDWDGLIASVEVTYPVSVREPRGLAHFGSA